MQTNASNTDNIDKCRQCRQLGQYRFGQILYHIYQIKPSWGSFAILAIFWVGIWWYCFLVCHVISRTVRVPASRVAQVPVRSAVLSLFLKGTLSFQPTTIFTRTRNCSPSPVTDGPAFQKVSYFSFVQQLLLRVSSIRQGLPQYPFKHWTNSLKCQYLWRYASASFCLFVCFSVDSEREREDCQANRTNLFRWFFFSFCKPCFLYCSDCNSEPVKGGCRVLLMAAVAR